MLRASLGRGRRCWLAPLAPPTHSRVSASVFCLREVRARPVHSWPIAVEGELDRPGGALLEPRAVSPVCPIIMSTHQPTPDAWAQSGVSVSKPVTRTVGRRHVLVPLSAALGALALFISLTAAISVWAAMYSLNNVGFTFMSQQVQVMEEERVCQNKLKLTHSHRSSKSTQPSTRFFCICRRHCKCCRLWRKQCECVCNR